MKLSILIPMYNAKNYIGNCIESLLNQNLEAEDYEIIIIDDGSTDNSVEIVSGFAKEHKNIHLFEEPNSGAYTTRNKLLKLAKGDYIYNLDADDYLVHNCIAELLDIAENKQLDIIGFETLETSDLSKFNLAHPIETDKAVFSTGEAFIENYPLLRHEIWWYFIKREFVETHGFMFNDNEYNADVMFTLQSLLKTEKVGYLPISLHRYVQTTDSLMRSQTFEIAKKRIEYIQMMITNTSQLINKLEMEGYSYALINNIKHRRDVFTFFNIVNMIRSAFGLDYIKANIRVFKSLNAYPIENFNHNRYNTFLYKLLKSIINNERLLYTLISIKSIFSKPKQS